MTMFKFISMVILVVLAFCAGRMSGSQPPIYGPTNIPLGNVQQEEVPFTQLDNAQIMALIRETRQMPDSFTKMTKLQALMNILRARGAIK